MQDLQAKLQQWQMLRVQADAISGQRKVVLENISELDATIKTINDLRDVDPGEEILFPLGAGSFAFGKIKDVHNILVDIGAGSFVKKNLPGVQEILVKRRGELERALTELDNNLAKIDNELRRLGSELEELAAKLRK
jgi:prefoldin alpha subunit